MKKEISFSVKFLILLKKMVSLVSAVDNETADKFLESLNFDDNGNLSGTLNTENEA